MLNIIKYEWISRWKFFLSGVILFILLDIEIIRNATNNSAPTAFAGILVAILFALGIALFLDHIGRMYKSLFKEDGYFLFTTPLTGYSILGGKMVTVFLEILGILLFWGGIAYIDYLILSPSLPEINFDLVFSSNHIFTALKVVFSIILGYLVFLLMIYLSMTLARSIFAAFKYGKALSLICFIVLSKVITEFSTAFYDLTNQGVHNAINFSPSVGGFMLINTIIFIVLFITTGYLLDRKINL
ncbi:hypothetical protein HNQ80_003973 [Anaerosolibacter carboniphilus]|uniref:Uncharacterized protein n=1 Tax=Anaerosolibacter carboniphilus TaxID=1417629 RepID=A0A841KWV1_9FIRM|nr:hypothetical protein [Anaerosolibacter carboniphilus]MBB6217837.1 hypothetical protein [Anaerosolibacter carboniphilus]